VGSTPARGTKIFYLKGDSVKIVINRCYGGFSLSKEAVELYGDYTGLNIVCEVGGHGDNIYYTNGVVAPENYFSSHDIRRDDPALIDVVAKLGSKAAGNFSDLKIVEIPDDVNWYIEEYDGIEHIAERHRTWE